MASPDAFRGGAPLWTSPPRVSEFPVRSLMAAEVYREQPATDMGREELFSRQLSVISFQPSAKGVAVRHSRLAPGLRTASDSFLTRFSQRPSPPCRTTPQPPRVARLTATQTPRRASS